MIDTIEGLRIVSKRMNEYKKTTAFDLRIMSQAIDELTESRKMLAVHEAEIYERIQNSKKPTTKPEGE